MSDTNIERTDGTIRHRNVPPYRTAFFAVLTVCAAYVALVLFMTLSGNGGGHH